MFRIESDLDIDHRSPKEVFDFLADFRNERLWNRMNRDPEKVTDGPIGAGTRFRAHNEKAGPVEIEIVEYARPRRLKLEIRMKMGTMFFTALTEERDGGTRVRTTNEVTSRGAFRLLEPLMRLMMRRELPKHHAGLRSYLEKEAAA